MKKSRTINRPAAPEANKRKNSRRRRDLRILKSNNKNEWEKEERKRDKTIEGENWNAFLFLTEAGR